MPVNECAPTCTNWCTRVDAPKMAQSSTVTCPASWLRLAKMVWLPTWQSCAKCTYAMIQFLLPTLVNPASWEVPRLMVTYSRNVLSSPISTRVGSPAYFLSCGGAPIEAECQMRLRRPMRVWPSSTTCAPTQLPSPTSTCSPITLYGPTSTSAASRAPACTIAVGWILLIDRAHGAQDRRLRDGGSRDARHAGELADAAQRALEGDVELELVAGDDRLFEARVVDADVVVDRILDLVRAVGKREHARGLRHRLQDQHPGHDRTAGKMTLEVRLVGRDVLHRHDTLARLYLLHPVDHQHRVALRQVPEHLVDVQFSHFSSPSPVGAAGRRCAATHRAPRTGRSRCRCRAWRASARSAYRRTRARGRRS